MLNKEDFKDFEALTEKNTYFSSSKLVTFSSEQKVILRKHAAILFYRTIAALQEDSTEVVPIIKRIYIVLVDNFRNISSKSSI